MPVFDAFVVAAIVVSFVVFGAVLAWAERQTRNLPPTPQPNVALATHDARSTVTPFRKAAA